MTYLVADEEQEIDAVLRAAVHSRWVELRKQQKASVAVGYGRGSWANSCGLPTTTCSRSTASR
jgi:hypothetical protein